MKSLNGETDTNSAFRDLVTANPVFFIVTIVLMLIIVGLVIYFAVCTWRAKKKAVPAKMVQPRKSSIDKTSMVNTTPLITSAPKPQRMTLLNCLSPFKKQQEKDLKLYSILGYYEPEDDANFKESEVDAVSMERGQSEQSMYSAVPIPHENELSDYLQKLTQESRKMSMSSSVADFGQSRTSLAPIKPIIGARRNSIMVPRNSVRNSILAKETFDDGHSVIPMDIDRMSFPPPVVTESDVLDEYLERLSMQSQSIALPNNEHGNKIQKLEPVKRKSKLGKRVSSLSGKSRPLSAAERLTKLLKPSRWSTLPQIKEDV